MMLPKNVNLPARDLDNRPNSPYLYQQSQVTQQGLQNEAANTKTALAQDQTSAIREAGLQATEASAANKAASDFLNYKITELQTRKNLDPIKSKVELAIMAQQNPEALAGLLA